TLHSPLCGVAARSRKAATTIIIHYSLFTKKIKEAIREADKENNIAFSLRRRSADAFLLLFGKKHKRA
ncbi:MAG: hypothetical protein ACI4RP_04520, partial [Acutalibacteraceae bacterium]